MEASTIIYGLACIVLGWGFIVIQKLSKTVVDLTIMLAELKQKDSDNEKSCAMKHSGIDRTFQRHEEVLKDHEKRIAKIEKN